MAVFVGVRAGICRMPAPSLMRSVRAREVRQYGRAVRAVLLQAPHRIDAEAIGALDDSRHLLKGITSVAKG
jgi:hypothetical protein